MVWYWCCAYVCVCQEQLKDEKDLLMMKDGLLIPKIGRHVFRAAQASTKFWGLVFTGGRLYRCVSMCVYVEVV